MLAKLYLLPNVLEESLPVEPFLPVSVKEAVEKIDGLIAESEKAARRYLRKFLTHEAMAKMPLALLNEHTQEISPLLKPLEKGECWGLISDAGLPCLADPGAELVWLAHQKGVEVEALVGPSSLILALQLSGFSAQSFSFHGYLPKEPEKFIQKVKGLEKEGGTHLWIEAPYRSAKLFQILKEQLKPATRLCVASQLTTPSQRVVSKTISDWKKISFPIAKEPIVFVIG